MFLVCTTCQRVYVKGQWVMATPPLTKISPTTCPDCAKQKGESSETPNMAFPHNKWGSQAK